MNTDPIPEIDSTQKAKAIEERKIIAAQTSPTTPHASSTTIYPPFIAAVAGAKTEFTGKKALVDASTLVAPEKLANENFDRRFERELTAIIPHVRAFGRKLCGTAHDADDLAQEACMKAWNSRQSYQLGTNMKAWVLMIARNQFYSEKRRSWRQSQLDQDAAEKTIPAPLDEQNHYMNGRDFEERLLPLLSQEQKESLILIGVQGLSYEEAAKIMGCAVGTIKSRISRCRTLLHEIAETLRPEQQKAFDPVATAEIVGPVRGEAGNTVNSSIDLHIGRHGAKKRTAWSTVLLEDSDYLKKHTHELFKRLMANGWVNKSLLAEVVRAKKGLSLAGAGVAIDLLLAGKIINRNILEEVTVKKSLLVFPALVDMTCAEAFGDIVRMEQERRNITALPAGMANREETPSTPLAVITPSSGSHLAL